MRTTRPSRPWPLGLGPGPTTAQPARLQNVAATATGDVQALTDKGTGSTTGDFGQKSKGTSAYTTYLELSPNRKRIALALAALGLGAAVRKLAR